MAGEKASFQEILAAISILAAAFLCLNMMYSLGYYEPDIQEFVPRLDFVTTNFLGIFHGMVTLFVLLIILVVLIMALILDHWHSNELDKKRIWLKIFENIYFLPAVFNVLIIVISIYSFWGLVIGKTAAQVLYASIVVFMIVSSCFISKFLRQNKTIVLLTSFVLSCFIFLAIGFAEINRVKYLGEKDCIYLKDAGYLNAAVIAQSGVNLLVYDYSTEDYDPIPNDLVYRIQKNCNNEPRYADRAFTAPYETLPPQLQP